MTSKYIFYIDFDGTLANTSELSPGGWNVINAYEASIKDIFGDVGLTIYKDDLGGLKNRAPSEIIYLLLQKGQEKNLRDELIRSAEIFYSAHQEQLEGLMSEGLGASFAYDTEEEIQERVIAELLVRQKLSKLIPEIGERFSDGRTWPEPFPGVIEFLNQMSTRNQDKISLIILTSGHDNFIRRTLKTWSVPDDHIHILSEDAIRGMSLPEQMWLRAKPGPLPMVLAYGDELNRQDRDETAWREQGLLTDRQHLIIAPLVDDVQTLIIGDDPKNDGGQVLIAGSFAWFNPSLKESSNPADTGIVFTDWYALTNLLNSSKSRKGIIEGRPIMEILTNQISRESEGVRLYGVTREMSRG